MSRIYFHSQDGEAELLGSERAYMGYHLVGKTAVGLLDSEGYGTQLNKFISPNHHMARMDPSQPIWARSYNTSFAVGWEDDGLITYRGKNLSPFRISLNTVLLTGSDPMKLAARLHGQCELHAWIDTPDCAWAADIMQAGLDSGIFRIGMGWDKVIEFLRASKAPVVTSYSVCDGFPNRHCILDTDEIAPAADDEADDWWYAQPKDWRWDAGMRWLRAQQGSGLQIKPDNWDRFHFGDGITVFDLIAKNYGKLMSTKLGLIDG